ncbi:hypothetical protein IKQ26_01185 [bacterium]|nr:hypothetical protein [bacterium]
MSEKVSQIDGRQKRQRKFRASFLTIVFLVIVTQLCFSSFRNFHKNVNFSSKIKKMEQRRDEEYNKYLMLKDQVDNFNSAKNSEAIARNNLKMAEGDEVLIIINKDDEKKSKEEDKH